MTRALTEALHARSAGLDALPAAAVLGLLADTGGSVKPAVLLAAGALTVEKALALLDGAGHNLRSALSRLGNSESERGQQGD